MIPNLKSKLKAMSSSSPSNKQAMPDSLEKTPYQEYERKNSSEKSNTRDNLGAEVIQEDGSFIRKRRLYGANAFYGSVKPAQLITWDFSDSQWWTRLEQTFYPEDIVFLDTETTGLSGGTGTCAFLIGLGYLTDKGLVVEQYLMRDFDEEYPMLKVVLDILKRYRILVSFNGKSFDCPLLENRMICSRLQPLHWDNAHLDLLHISRRLWSNRLKSCSLSSIEKNILGVARNNDIPGAMIPKAYLDYLDTRNTDEMQRIIKHNEWDIVAMAALLLRVSKLFMDPTLIADDYELLGIAKELERNHRIQEAADCYEKCIKTASNHSLQIEAKKRIAYLKKRYLGPEEAMEVWADLAGAQGNMLVFPFIEMAKYFEHKMKDFNKAMDCTEKAIQLVKLRMGSSFKLQEELFTRRRRLIRKLEGSKEKWG